MGNVRIALRRSGRGSVAGQASPGNCSEDKGMAGMGRRLWRFARQVRFLGRTDHDSWWRGSSALQSTVREEEEGGHRFALNSRPRPRSASTEALPIKPRHCHPLASNRSSVTSRPRHCASSTRCCVASALTSRPRVSASAATLLASSKCAHRVLGRSYRGRAFSG